MYPARQYVLNPWCSLPIKFNIPMLIFVKKDPSGRCFGCAKLSCPKAIFILLIVLNILIDYSSHTRNPSSQPLIKPVLSNGTPIQRISQHLYPLSSLSKISPLTLPTILLSGTHPFLLRCGSTQLGLRTIFLWNITSSRLTPPVHPKSNATWLLLFRFSARSFPFKYPCIWKIWIWSLAPCLRYTSLAPDTNPNRTASLICEIKKVKCKNGTITNRFQFPTLLLSNAESLNFEKLNELDTLSKIYR